MAEIADMTLCLSSSALIAFAARACGALPLRQLATILPAYLIALGLSGRIVRAALRWTGHAQPMSDPKTARSGMLIGKCENILVVTLVLLEAYTALALIFTAKSLVRRDTTKDSEYLLGGTLVNVTWSVLVALAARWVLRQTIR